MSCIALTVFQAQLFHLGAWESPVWWVVHVPVWSACKSAVWSQIEMDSLWCIENGYRIEADLSISSSYWLAILATLSLSSVCWRTIESLAVIQRCKLCESIFAWLNWFQMCLVASRQLTSSPRVTTFIIGLSQIVCLLLFFWVAKTAEIGSLIVVRNCILFALPFAWAPHQRKCRNANGTGTHSLPPHSWMQL